MILDLDRTAWTRVRLGDVVNQSKDKVDPADGSVERYVAGSHMSTDDLKIHSGGCVTDGYLGPAFHRRFRPGQVLYGSRRTYLRKVAVAEFDGVCANTTFVLESKNQQTLLTRFLPFVLTTEAFHTFSISESKGSVNPYVNWSDIAKYQFDLPPVDQQQRVADLLWAIEKERQSASARLACLKTAVSAVAEDRVWRKGYRRSRIQEVLESCTYGTSERCDSEPGLESTPVLRIPNVVSGKLLLGDLKYLPDYRSEDDKASLQAGDFLIVRTNGNPTYVSRGALVPTLDRVFLFASYLLRLRVDRASILPEYLAAAWETPAMKEQLARDIKSSAGNYNLSAASVLKQTLPLPPIRQQEEITAELSYLDATVMASSVEGEELDIMQRAIHESTVGGAA